MPPNTTWKVTGQDLDFCWYTVWDTGLFSYFFINAFPLFASFQKHETYCFVSFPQWFPSNFLSNHKLMYLNIFVKFQSFKVIIFISGQMIISLA